LCVFPSLWKEKRNQLYLLDGGITNDFKIFLMYSFLYTVFIARKRGGKTVKISLLVTTTKKTLAIRCPPILIWQER
jgi:hypothetical protein